MTSPRSAPSAPPRRAAARCLQALMVRRAIEMGDYPAALGSDLAHALEGQACRELAEAPPVATPERDLLDRRLCRFLAEILSRRGPDVHDYLRVWTAYGPQTAIDDLHDCGRRLVRTPLHPRWLTAGERWLDSCERCGTVANQPAGLPPLRGRSWYASSLQPVGGHPERPTPVQPLTGDLVPAQVAPGWPDTGLGGLRRWGAAIVSDGDYVVLQRTVIIGAHPT
jgi:hypothetical protein